ncbi:MAG: L-threonylcarbamoyladenylate synthase [candidate division NC10 bacterium]|nr:L-threonylcarbamoyladenylate synthase [candidate division NC10 bacterium]
MPPARMTKLLPINPRRPEEEIIHQAAQALREGKLVAFPTDTLYGLGADATNSEAVEAVFSAKGRPKEKPLIVLARDLSMVEELVVGIDGMARSLMDRFWPGPLTLILHSSPRLPSSLTGNTRKVGVRIPASEVSLGLLRATSLPLTAPSANRSGGPDPLNAQIVWEELSGRIDWLLDGGPLTGIPSTVLDLTDRPPRILRQGAVPAQALLEFITGKEGP